MILNRQIFRNLISAIVLLMLLDGYAYAQKKQLIDGDATKETKRLYKSLGKLSRKSTLFGHQHATEYGHGWSGDLDRSDVKSVTGSHPAVIGVDIMGFSGRSPEMIQRTKDEL